MAYERNKVILFGVGGVAIAAILMLVFLPARVEIGLNPTVALQEIPGYGFQIIKISGEQANVVHLNITLDSFEVKKDDGNWAEIDVFGGSASFNLLRDQEISIATEVVDLELGSYSAIRFQVVRGLEFTNATLSTEEVVAVDTPNFMVEFTSSMFEIVKETDNLSLELRIGSGILSNYMLPDMHMSIGTMKISVSVSDA